jgi:restriction system protein
LRVPVSEIGFLVRNNFNNIAAFRNFPARFVFVVGKSTQGRVETMELTDYPLLHEADLMLTLLKVAAQGPASLEDAIERLRQNLQSVGESPPVSDEEIQAYLSRVREHLVQAVLLVPQDDGRLVITPRGMKALSDHPGGIDDSVLMNYPEFRVFIETRSGYSMKTVGDKDVPGDDPHIAQFDQGYAAFNDGLDINDNPHSRDKPMHIAWENGRAIQFWS